MCGIAGFLTAPGRFTAASLSIRCKAMADAVARRGPDDSGVWVDAQAGIALGHRRLSIVDLSPLGHQPMASASGRFTVAYNGEVYNFLDLRVELESAGHRFRGNSDTEVLLAGFEEWGVVPTLERSAGMFALAAWDGQDGELTLVRDRFGKKPLLYGQVGGVFGFASESRALGTLGPLGSVDEQALRQQLRHGYVTHPATIRAGVRSLPPGHALRLRPGQAVPAPSPYWSAAGVADAARREGFQGDAQQAADGLEKVLRLAVRQRMVADVPLGAFLSGGIDSSIVVALMQRESESPVRTFTIGFDEGSHDEAEHARRVAEHLGTAHKELTVRPEDALKAIPDLARVYDSPFADSSQVPTLLLSRLARREVTVALSGDGGDEIFGGYNRYAEALSLWRKVRWAPRPLRKLAGGALRLLPPRAWDRAQRALLPVLPRPLRHRTLGDKVHRASRILQDRSVAEVYLHLLAGGEGDRALRRAPASPPPALATLPGGLAPEEKMMLWDTLSYLPDDILEKVDRASMDCALEVRAPLLDHRVFAYAWRLPLAMKVRGGQGKWLLRQVLHRHVPAALVERPKTGFGIPLGAWLRDPLRPWAEGLLEPARLRREGFLDPDVVAKAWREHQSGRRDWANRLWPILLFQAWLDANPDALPAEGRPARPSRGAP